VLAGRAGYPRGRSALALALCALSILLGSKLLYLVEAQLFPNDGYLSPELRTALNGFRIPGGIALLALTVPLACSALRLPWRRFGDRLIPMAAVALIFIRLGCFMNGCCFGSVSTRPWAIRFPAGSDVFWYQQAQGWIDADALASLPVHPLQLYFAGASFAIFVVLLAARHRPVFPGQIQLLFYFLFFASTELLEPFRARHLTLNHWLCGSAVIITGTLLIAAAVAASARQHHERRSTSPAGAPNTTTEVSG
jgi:prolipoprotein diacylglyceryltransferase